jgi:hypothetical protein
MLTYLLKWDNSFTIVWQTKLLQGNGNRGRCELTTKTSKPFSVREVSILTAACWQPSWLVTAVPDTVHTASVLFPALLLYVGWDSSVGIATHYGLDGLTLYGLDGPTLYGLDGLTLYGLDGLTLYGLDGPTLWAGWSDSLWAEWSDSLWAGWSGDQIWEGGGTRFSAPVQTSLGSHLG